MEEDLDDIVHNQRAVAIAGYSIGCCEKDVAIAILEGRNLKPG